MRTKIMMALSVIILVFLNYGIYEKEQTKKYGQTLLLRLEPVDPRSLMQGDYMELGYDIEIIAPEPPSDRKYRYMVIRPDENNVAQFVRFYKEEKLAPNEYLIRFSAKRSRINIVPRDFFFQEGHAKYYEDAKYAVFKFDNKGNYLLTGLATKDKKEIIIPH